MLLAGSLVPEGPDDEVWWCCNHGLTTQVRSIAPVRMGTEVSRLVRQCWTVKHDGLLYRCCVPGEDKSRGGCRS